MITLEKILGALTGKENLYRCGRNFTVIEEALNNSGDVEAHNTDATAHQDIRTQINSLDAEIEMHEIKKTNVIYIVSRDASIVGIQSILINEGQLPKKIDVNAGIFGSKKRSVGVWDENGTQFVVASDENGMTLPDGSKSIILAGDAGNNVFGVIQSVTKDSFEINWQKSGTGITGTMSIFILVTYHD